MNHYNRLLDEDEQIEMVDCLIVLVKVVAVFLTIYGIMYLGKQVL